MGEESEVIAQGHKISWWEGHCISKCLAQEPRYAACGDRVCILITPFPLLLGTAELAGQQVPLLPMPSASI